MPTIMMNKLCKSAYDFIQRLSEHALGTFLRIGISRLKTYKTSQYAKDHFTCPSPSA